MQNVDRLSTGSMALDSLLGGGLRMGSLTEVYGASSVGKSQLAFTLCVTAQLGNRINEERRRVAFIDTGGTFRSCRVIQIAERFGLCPSTTLTQIDYTRAFNCDHLLHLLQLADEFMTSQRHSILILDSIGDAIRSDFPYNVDIWERQSKLGQILRQCAGLSTKHGIAVLLVNQVFADFGFGSGVKAVGGALMANASQTRLWMKREETEVNSTCVLIKPSNYQFDQVKVRITSGGIGDV